MTTKKPEKVIAWNESEMPIETFYNWRLLVSGGIVVSLLAVILYINTLFNDYAYDDTAVIVGNSLTKQGISGIPEILKTSYWYGFTGLNEYIYRPIPLISFAIEWQLSPGNPHLNHFSNIFLYALTGFFLFIFLARLLRDFNLVIPFIASLIFIAHPIHTEVVANIKGRDEIFCFLFFLISGIALLKSIDKKSLVWAIVASLSYFLSLCSKETAYTFIFIFPLIIFYFRNIRTKNLFYCSALFLFTLLIYILVRASILPSLELHKETDFLNNSLVLATDFNTRIGTAFFVLGQYIKLMIFPHPLSSDYSYSQIQILGIFNSVSFISILFYLVIIICAVIKLFQKNIISFSIFIFLLPLSLIANLFFLTGSTMAERFLYIPSLGFSIAFAWLIVKVCKISSTKENYRNLFSPIRSNTKFSILILITLIFYSFKTIDRNTDWKNNFTLFSADSKTSSNSALLHYNLGGMMFNLAKQDGTDEKRKNQLLSEAQMEFQTAYSIYPDYFEAYYQLAESYYFENKDSLAIVNYKKSLFLNPENIVVNKNLAIALVRISESRKSKKVIESLITREELLSLVNFLDSAREIELPAKLYNELLAYEQIDIRNYSEAGVKYYHAGQFRKAIEMFSKIISVDSNNVDALNNLGSSYASINEYEKAEECFRKVISLQPDDPVNYSNLGVLLKQRGDSVSAEIYFTKAKELRNNLSQ